jgi:hypothetical protein
LKKERQSFSIEQTFPSSSKKEEAIVITKIQVDLLTKCDPWNNDRNFFLFFLLFLIINHSALYIKSLFSGHLIHNLYNEWFQNALVNSTIHLYDRNVLIGYSICMMESLT